MRESNQNMGIEFKKATLKIQDDRNATISLEEDASFKNIYNIYDVYIEDTNIEYVMIREDTFNNIFNRLKDVEQKMFLMQLEKNLLSQMPIDIDDAMAVGKLELKNIKSPATLDLKKFAQKIKTSYPNLFYT